MFQREADDLLNVFPMAYIAGERKRAFCVPQSFSGCFGPADITREQDDARTMIGKDLRDRLAVTKTYDDGKLDIVTQGRERFEILELNQERTFLRGEIQYVTDEPDKPTEQELAHAVELHRQILALANSEQDLPADEDSLLSYHLAGSLPLDLDFKQKMLSRRSEAQRIQNVITYFEGILPNLRRAVTMRQKAGGNGHAR